MLQRFQLVKGLLVHICPNPSGRLERERSKWCREMSTARPDVTVIVHKTNQLLDGVLMRRIASTLAVFCVIPTVVMV